jgi:hypothetical protein
MDLELVRSNELREAALSAVGLGTPPVSLPRTLGCSAASLASAFDLARSRTRSSLDDLFDCSLSRYCLESGISATLRLEESSTIIESTLWPPSLYCLSNANATSSTSSSSETSIMPLSLTVNSIFSLGALVGYRLVHGDDSAGVVMSERLDMS